jgi:hypothetical protein
MLIRVGIPSCFRRFTRAACEIGAPVLVSANALRRNGRFRHPSADLFNGCNVALDSAGFVAMKRYGGFPWSVEEYVALAAAHPWSWWASMDLCCEPEVAAGSEEVRRRQAETTRLLGACRDEAERIGASLPIPVLQGWAPADYVQHALDQPELPSLVGVGSVCRRRLTGPHGLLQVIETLDRALPRHVRLHLFGVKRTALDELRGNPRVASIDSMAWDSAARDESFRHRRAGGGSIYTVQLREKHLRSWYGDQRGRLGLFAHSAAA